VNTRGDDVEVARPSSCVAAAGVSQPQTTNLGKTRRDASRSVAVLILLTAVWVLNAADFVLTLHAMSVGRALEVNQVMDYLFEVGPVYAGVCKIGIASLGVALLWLLRRHGLAVVASYGLALIFSALVTFETLSLFVS
jgi:hypothetical protein